MDNFGLLFAKSLGGGGGSGTDNYNELSNKPQINSITLSGNKSLTNLGIQAELIFDDEPTEDSTNPVTSGAVYTALATKQDMLTVDSSPTENSTNPVQSGGVYTALAGKEDTLTFDNAPTNNSDNPVKSGGIYTALGQKQDALTFDGTYSASTNKAATVSTVTNAVNALDVTGDASVSASKTISAWSETDGKVSISTQDIAIAGAQATLTGYTKSGIAGQAVASTDNVNQAIGKLEATVDDNKNNILLVEKANGAKNLIFNFGKITNGGCDFVYGTGGQVTVSGTKSGALAIANIISNEDLADYGLSTGDQIVLVSNNTNIGTVVIFEDSQGTQDSAIYVYNGVKTVTIPSGRTKWYVRLQVKPATTGTISETVKPMICTKALYDLDNSFVPYAMSNIELTAKEQANENNISIVDISDKITPASGYTINSLTKLYMQGSHVFGHLIVSKNDGNFGGAQETIARFLNGYRPRDIQVQGCFFGTTEYNTQYTGYAYIQLASASSGQGSVIVKSYQADVGTVANIHVDFIV